jgi:hypothetical protein
MLRQSVLYSLQFNLGPWKVNWNAKDSRRLGVIQYTVQPWTLEVELECYRLSVLYTMVGKVTSFVNG